MYYFGPPRKRGLFRCLLLYRSDFIIRNAWHNKRELAVSNFCGNPMTYSKINQFMINLVSLFSFSKDIRTMNTWVLLCIFFGGDYKMQTLHIMYKINQYKFTVVYCESVNLIGYITVDYLLIVNSCASVHITHHV